MKKLLCLLLCILLMLCCACKKEQKIKTAVSNSEKQISIPSVSINLLYSYGDGFNPYTANTEENRRICSLLFDPLVKVNNKMESEYILAESVALEGDSCTVSLRNAAFSDGSPVTADDVIYSYTVARASETGGYSVNFYEVSSVYAKNNKTVVFELTQNDPFFTNLLTFPIIKAHSDGNADSDGVAIPPIGSGRFIVSEDRKSFSYNKNYYGKIGNISKIYLLDAPDADSVAHYVEVGACDIYYTDKSNGNILRMSGKRTDANINRLIYIGINESYGMLNIKEMRYAISSAIDRKDIVTSAYYNNAVCATGYFNPALEITKPANTLKENSDIEITVENLKKMGYNDKNADGYYINSSGNCPEYTLLVNEDNLSRVEAAELIAKHCKAAGIKIKVIKCPYEQYLTRLSTGDFQLYIGEIQLLANMDFSPLVVPGGTASYGVTEAQPQPEGAESKPEDSSEAAKPGDNADAQKPAENPETPESIPLSKNLEAYYNGELGALDMAGILISEMPQIPICYRSGLLFYNKRIKGGVVASPSDVYYSISDYTF